INAIRGVAVEHKQPICMMIGLLQHDPEKAPKESPRYGVRIVEPILDDMGIAHHLLSVDADVAKIKPAIDKAYAESQPVALLIGGSPKVSCGNAANVFASERATSRRRRWSRPTAPPSTGSRSPRARSTICRSAPWASIHRMASDWRSAGPTRASWCCKATAAC